VAIYASRILRDRLHVVVTLFTTLLKAATSLAYGRRRSIRGCESVITYSCICSPSGMAGVRQRQKAKSSVGDVTVEPSKGAKGARRGTREAVVTEEATPPKGRLFFRVAEAAAGRHLLSPDDALEAMHWIRQIIGLAGGIAFGVSGVRGLSPISIFLMSSFVVPNSFFQGQLRVDEEQVEKVGSLKTEGLASSTALFFLFWILSYTTFMR
jgi:hypothetical protein